MRLTKREVFEILKNGGMVEGWFDVKSYHAQLLTSTGTYVHTQMGEMAGGIKKFVSTEELINHIIDNEAITYYTPIEGFPNEEILQKYRNDVKNDIEDAVERKIFDPKVLEKLTIDWDELEAHLVIDESKPVKPAEFKLENNCGGDCPHRKH